jgi:hypothetical protein
MQFETARHIGAKTPKVYRRRARRRSAALQALTAARLLAAGMADSAVSAAAMTGSNPAYVGYAVTVLKVEDQVLISRILTGQVSLPRAAQQAKRVADLIHAYRSASEADIIQAVKIVGPVLVAAE